MLSFKGGPFSPKVVSSFLSINLCYIWYLVGGGPSSQMVSSWDGRSSQMVSNWSGRSSQMVSNWGGCSSQMVSNWGLSFITDCL